MFNPSSLDVDLLEADGHKRKPPEKDNYSLVGPGRGGPVFTETFSNNRFRTLGSDFNQGLFQKAALVELLSLFILE